MMVSKIKFLAVVGYFQFSIGPHFLEWTITGEPFEACVRPGQTLTFEWEGPYHNVERVDLDGYENCSGFKNTEGVEGPYVFKAKREGEYYFVCGVRHMIFIAKVKVNL